MNMYFVTRWSLVPGDCAYVEASCEADAVTFLAAELKRRDDFGDRPALVEWQAKLLKRPLLIVRYRD